jgi:hypothetical protein
VAFPEQRQVSSVAFAVHGGGVIGEGGPDLMTVDRLVTDVLLCPTRSLMSSRRTSRVLRMDTNECRSSRGVQAPPSLAALVIFWSSCLRCRRAVRIVDQAFVKALACFAVRRVSP